MFERIQDNGLTIKPNKIETVFPEVTFLGHTMKHGNIATYESIVSKIVKIEPPRTRKHVQALLGLVNYYAKYIPCFAENTAVLSSLLRKEHKGKIVWSQQCQEILDNIKIFFFLSAPILRLRDYNKKFVI